MTEVEVRPPRAPLAVIGAVAALTAPLAVAAVALGDVGLGLIALLSAAWAGSVAVVGWTARAVADRSGVVVRWMRSTSTVTWDDVLAVEVDDAAGWRGGRGALLRCADGTTVRWTPWLPVLWFAARSARSSVDALAELVEGLAVDGSAPGIEVVRLGDG